MALLSILGAFGKTEQDPVYGSEYGAGELNEWMKSLSDFNSTTRKAAISDYASRLNAATPANEAASAEKMKFFRDTISNAGSYNPFETSVRPAADYAFGKLNEFSQFIPSLTRRMNNQNAISLGLAPGGRSSAVDRAQYSGAAQAWNQGLGTILPAITQWSQLDDAARRDQFARSVFANESLGLEPDRLAGRALLPMNVEAAGYSQDIPNLAALIQSANSNIQGYTPHPNTLAKMGMADQALVDNVSQWAGVYGSLYGSGTGGMYGGGGGGGGSGGAAIPTGPAPYGTTIKWNSGYPQSVAPSPWSGYSSPWGG